MTFRGATVCRAAEKWPSGRRYAFDEFYKTYGVMEPDGMYLAPWDRIAVW